MNEVQGCNSLKMHAVCPHCAPSIQFTMLGLFSFVLTAFLQVSLCLPVTFVRK